MWRYLGLAFIVLFIGLTMSVVGLAGDFYEHEIVGLSPALESIFAPVHLLIFGGIAVAGLGFLSGAIAPLRSGHTPCRMVLRA